MKKKVILLLGFLLVFITAYAFAQDVKALQEDSLRDSQVNKLIDKAFETRFGTFEIIRGDAIALYQWVTSADINGVHYDDQNYGLVSVQIDVGWKPIKDGEFIVRFKYTDNGDDPSDPNGFRQNALLSTLNESLTTSSGEVRIMKAFYKQQLFDERLFFLVGKTHPEEIMDDNVYANDQRSQFIGQPLVDNPFFDSEDNYFPILAVGGYLLPNLKIAFAVQSTSWAALPTSQQKSGYSDLFNQPFYGGQVTYSPKIGELQGNYRFYGWNFGYDVPKLYGTGTTQRWGLGVSIDQQLTKKIGVFSRIGYQNPKAYQGTWFLSAGTSLTGIIPGRDKDIFGIGFGSIFANPDTPNHGTETHLEAYYNFKINSFFEISPDIQYVVDPLGNSDNNNVFSAMIRARFYI